MVTSPLTAACPNIAPRLSPGTTDPGNEHARGTCMVAVFERMMSTPSIQQNRIYLYINIGDISSNRSTQNQRHIVQHANSTRNVCTGSR